MKRVVMIGCLACVLCTGTLYGSDWPQVQRDSARTGRTQDVVAPPYRARWIWVGPSLTLRNNASNAAWTDDLTTRSGYTFPLPQNVGHTVAGTVQPVIASGKVFFGTMEGDVYALDAGTGATLWGKQIPGGVVVSAAVVGDIVVFAGVTGRIAGFHTTDGTPAWTYDCVKACTCAPCVAGNIVVVADHGGYLYALDITSGGHVWKIRLPAPVQGGVAIAQSTIFVGAENMYVYAVSIASGQILAQHRVKGQSFRFNNPVVFNSLVWTQTSSVPAIGSEYVMETLMDGSADFATEETNVAQYLQGSTNGGAWAEASPDWQHLFALNSLGLSEPYTVLCGPVEGCGMPAEPVCIDNDGRVLAWWKTRFPTLTHLGAFGTKYSMDIAAVDQSTGHRIRIDNGKFSNMYPGPESDNLYAMSVGGNYLWLRQNFRGTEVIQLKTSDFRFVQCEIRNQDGGTFAADIIYADQTAGVPQTPQTALEGRMAPALSGSYVYISEHFGITCIEHQP